VVAVDKPPGLPVVPARNEDPADSLHHRLQHQRGERLWVVHRIDREASGLLLFARTAEAHRALSLAFEHRQVEKAYTAFAAGPLTPSHRRIEVALHAARRGKTRPAEPGEPGSREATTLLVVERVWRRDAQTVCLLDVRPLTGRHHQIRVHLRWAGAPLLFDPLYGRRVLAVDPEDTPCRRLALHARWLLVPHPTSGAPLQIEAPLASDLVDLREWLEAHFMPGEIRP
jgi:RluA family pseudouridine synthase